MTRPLCLLLFLLLGPAAMAEPPRVRGLPEGSKAGTRPDATLPGGGMTRRDAGNAHREYWRHARGEASTGATAPPADRFASHDLDGDGAVSKAEAAGHPALMGLFDRADRNRDGLLTVAEYERATKAPEKGTKKKPAARASRAGDRPNGEAMLSTSGTHSASIRRHLTDRRPE